MTSPAKPTVQPGKLFINNEWRDAANGATFDTTNPATGEVITQLAKAGKEDVDAAVMAAREAFEGKEWNKFSTAKRGELLWKIGELIMQRADEIAYLETIDNGKPIFESRYVDIPMVANVFKYYAGWATKVHGETIPLSGNSLNYTLREPIGVIGAITPWNFPLLLASWKIAPALACGNAIVLKPAQLTSLSALKLAEIFVEAGAPAGIFN
ncbi:MAG TPA: aldehyde dehydrogenase family protein, partial [Blastocatellia bacterium]|nr:aldehyde dehydrogenase family protein [Blastocatellia bacterium]